MCHSHKIHNCRCPCVLSSLGKKQPEQEWSIQATFRHWYLKMMENQPATLRLCCHITILIIIPCLPESQELEHTLQGIMTCFKDVKHYIDLSLSVLPSESEGTDMMLSIKKSVTKDATHLQHYEIGTGKKKIREAGSWWKIQWVKEI